MSPAQERTRKMISKCIFDTPFVVDSTVPSPVLQTARNIKLIERIKKISPFCMANLRLSQLHTYPF